MDKWDYAPDLTSEILDNDNSVITNIASALRLKAYNEYYRLDSILFEEKHKYGLAPASQTWVTKIKIAFEHENYFNSGLFTEMSHLMITDCELAVLVSYPNYKDEIKREIKTLHDLISQSESCGGSNPRKEALFILGWKIENEVLWFLCRYEKNDWQMLNSDIDEMLVKAEFHKEIFSKYDVVK